MLSAILEIISGLINKVFPIIEKWMRKSAMEKEEDAKLQVREQTDYARKTGRPKWD